MRTEARFWAPENPLSRGKARLGGQGAGTVARVSQGTRTLSRTGTLVRGVATVTALAVLGVGQWRDTNDLFPFGSLSQYATARDMNGTVRSVFLQADTAGTDGGAGDERVRVPLDQHVVGVGRAEIEGQLSRIVADPSLLQGLAQAYAAMHPERPPLRRLHLMRSERRLRDGVVVGSPVVEQLATWTVREDSG